MLRFYMLFAFFKRDCYFFIDTSLDTLISAAVVGDFNSTGAEKKNEETSADEIIRAISLFCGILGSHQLTNLRELEDSCVPSSKFSVVFIFCCCSSYFVVSSPAYYIFVLSKSWSNLSRIFFFFLARHLFKFAALFLSATKTARVSADRLCAMAVEG